MTAIIVIIAVLLVILFAAVFQSGSMGSQENPPPSPPGGQSCRRAGKMNPDSVSGTFTATTQGASATAATNGRCDATRFNRFERRIAKRWFQRR